MVSLTLFFGLGSFWNDIQIFDWAAHLLNAYIYIYILSYMYIYCMHTCFYMSVGSARYIPLLMVKIWVVPQGKIRWTPQKHHGIYRKKQNYPKLHVLPISLKGDDPWCHNSPGDGEQCSPSLLLLGRRQCSSGQPLWPGELEWEVWSCGACSFFVMHVLSLSVPLYFSCNLKIYTFSHIFNSVWKRIIVYMYMYICGSYHLSKYIYNHLIV